MLPPFCKPVYFSTEKNIREKKNNVEYNTIHFFFSDCFRKYRLRRNNSFKGRLDSNVVIPSKLSTFIRLYTVTAPSEGKIGAIIRKAPFRAVTPLVDRSLGTTLFVSPLHPLRLLTAFVLKAFKESDLWRCNSHSRIVILSYRIR